eukprot:Tbor_TRINITY_DN5209_c0_g1::TRINITY_DN5209_c0_g1_i1::g.16389::m.16389
MGFFGGPSKIEEQEKILREQRIHAQKIIAVKRQPIQKATSDIEFAQTNQYVWYGWRGTTAFTIFASAMAVGERIPFFRTYVSWIGLAGGYYLGSLFHNLHVETHKRTAVRAIDDVIPFLETNEKKFTPKGVPEYKLELAALKAMRAKLSPDLEQLLKAQQEAQKSQDERVDDLIKRYEEEKKSETGY